MLTAIVVIYLFSHGVLGLVVFWKAHRYAEMARARGLRIERRLARANRHIAALRKEVRESARVVCRASRLGPHALARVNDGPDIRGGQNGVEASVVISVASCQLAGLAPQRTR